MSLTTQDVMVDESGQGGAIVITSEMVDAGVRELLFWFDDVVSESGQTRNAQAVAAVFSSMVELSRC